MDHSLDIGVLELLGGILLDIMEKYRRINIEEESYAWKGKTGAQHV